MKFSTKLMLGLMVIGMIGILAWRLVGDKLEAQTVFDTSEAKDLQGKVTIAMDNFQGYFHLRSPRFKKSMRQIGYRIDVVDDKADYPTRMEKLAKGEYDMIVATVDSYLLNAAKQKYPGVITMVIDESKGADAIVALRAKGENLPAFMGQRVRVGFTPNSPSHHVLKAVKSHFAAESLLPDAGSPLRVETSGSEEALKKLLSGQLDVAALWEPDVSKALKDPKLVKVFSTAETSGYIVDILVVNRKFLTDNQVLVKKVLATYFRELKWYSDNEAQLVTDIKAETSLSDDEIKALIKGISWQNLTDNARRWFGISQPGENADETIVTTIEATVAVLIDNHDFSESPLPNADPYFIFYADALEDLYKNGLASFGNKAEGLSAGPKIEFSALSPERWQQLQVVGNLKVQSIVFQSGTAVMGFNGKLELDELAKKLGQYPTYRVKVIGHTSTSGDAEANRLLSQERAVAVVQYLTVVHDIDANRCLSVGRGGDEPLPQLPDETEKRWEMRLKRVEVILVKEEF